MSGADIEQRCSGRKIWRMLNAIDQQSDSLLTNNVTGREKIMTSFAYVETRTEDELKPGPVELDMKKMSSL